MKKTILILFMSIGRIALSVQADEIEIQTEVIEAAPTVNEETVAVSTRTQAIVTLWEEGKKRQAHLELRRWMKSDKASPEPWVLAARFHCEEKRYKRCLKMASRALVKMPQLAEAYYWRGRAYESMGKRLEAANEYKAALRSDESFTPAQEALDSLQSSLRSDRSETQASTTDDLE